MMDVNGTRFHLFYGRDDWLAWKEEPAGPGPSVVAWDPASETIGLAQQLLIPRGLRSTALEQGSRRCAAADAYGNWYWISQDRVQIFWSPSGTRRAVPFWSQPAQALANAPGGRGRFSAARPLPQLRLGALAVTAHHYLVAAFTSPGGGVLIFDLHAGGEPLRQEFALARPFQPSDMAAAPDGRVWILDADNHRLWGLDRDFRLIGAPAPVSQPAVPGGFHALGVAPAARVTRPPAAGFALAAADPVAIEALPDGTLLLLETPPGGGASHLHHLADGLPVSLPLTLPDLAPILADAPANGQPRLLAAYDLACPNDRTLYVVDRDGNQAFAFTLVWQAAGSPPGGRPRLAGVKASREYLPMHYFGSRALAAFDGGVYYDVAPGDGKRDAGVRWARLQAISEPRVARRASLVSPVLDGRQQGCVWHRLFVDGCIPPEARLLVSTRCADDPAALASLPFTAEPPLYLRQAGPELPYFRHFTSEENPDPADGSWELLFQRAEGRYLQIQLELSSNGRLGPHLRALRAYYPRFSYVKNYLPAIYQDEPQSASFLERLLANLEGFYSEIEGKIAGVQTLFDARSAPAETLDWLASWVGLTLDPLWAHLQERRRQSLPAWSRYSRPSTPPPDRRRLFIRFAMRLYQRRGTLDGIRFALHLLLDPCLEVFIERLQCLAVDPAGEAALRLELGRLGLPLPASNSSAYELEELLFAYLLAPGRPSHVRLVERFQTRGGRALAAGDPTQPANDSGGAESGAHEFIVLIPEGLPADETAMVERVVRLEKPAHTRFELRRFFDAFRVGEVRLGQDTLLGESGRFTQIILGSHYLSEGYLEAAHPMNLTGPDRRSRLVTGRDRLGEFPGPAVA